jgi:beta-glucosidase
LPAERRAVLLVGAMTEDEKLESLAGDDLVGPLKAADDGRFRAGTVHGVSRLGVPELHLVDAGALGVKQGPSTALASGLSLAATFDTRAAERAAAIAADEAAHRGNDVMLGPAVDIMRTPRGGRTFEAYGEDPFLSSRLAATWVKTVQKAGLMAEVKHFPANNQETERFTVNAVIGQRALREIYLAPFEAAVRQARAASVMCAYNLVNGSPSCSNQPLLKRVLREEWGHQGMVVSDWIRGAKETTGSVTSGLDLEMPVAALYSPVLIRHALSEGKVTWADLDGLLAHRLRVMFEYGMFDRAPRANDNRIDFAGHAKAAQRLSEQGITLLKNRGGVLPLKPGTRIAVIGEPAAQFRSGIGSAYVKPISTITPLRGLTTRAGAGNVRYADGTNLAAAVKAARAAKAAVVFVADSRAEDADVPCLTLRCGDPKLGDQDALVRAVAAANPRTVVVLQTGGPVLTPWAGTVPGIVETWYPGGHGGAAIARVLYGDVDPGGRLPVSFPTREADAPAAGGKSQYPGDGGVATYSEGVFVGYRHYDAKKITPAFPFGHGLSYTTFKLSGLTVSRNQAQVTVTNTGRRRGNAVPQLYLGLPGTADIPQPPRQLKGFTTVSLAPGASTRVTFPLDTRAFSSWDEATGTWKTASGCVNVMAGASSRDIKLSRKLCL